VDRRVLGRLGDPSGAGADSYLECLVWFAAVVFGLGGLVVAS
jgi:hypothetical protein